MKRIGLFYFSGTRNTKLVTNHIAEEFTQMGFAVSVFNIERIHTKAEVPNMDEYDFIGIGSQIIGYTTPRRMNQFLKLIEPSEKRSKVFIYRTCGGVAETNYTASHYLIKILRKKNYDVFYERLFSIGSNWAFKFDDIIMQQLYEATLRKIKVLCQEVIEGKQHFYETTLGLRLKKKFISSQAKIMFRVMGKNMKVSDDCTKCGICTSNCPSKNVELVKGKVSFKADCSACLRCVYKCPKNAISFRFLKFIPLKNGYDVHKSLTLDPMLEKDTNGRIPAFFNRYISDDTM